MMSDESERCPTEENKNRTSRVQWALLEFGLFGVRQVVEMANAAAQHDWHGANLAVFFFEDCEIRGKRGASG